MPTVSTTTGHASDVRQLVARTRLADEWVLAGRHAAAERLLREVAFALDRRRGWRAAAAAWQMLGMQLLERGRATDACASFDAALAAARQDGGASTVAWEASVWLATAATDAGQLVRAESLCDDALQSPPDSARALWASAVLANVRLWQRRFDALPPFDVDAGRELAALPRAITAAAAVQRLLIDGDLFRAGLLARASLSPCVTEGGPVDPSAARASHVAAAIASTAHLRVLCETGDLDLAAMGLEAAMTHARAARAPVRAFTARLVWAGALARAGRSGAARREHRHLQRAAAMLPPLLRAAVQEGEPSRTRTGPAPHEGVSGFPAVRDVRLVTHEADDVAAAHAVMRSAARALALWRLDLFVLRRPAAHAPVLVTAGPALSVGAAGATSIAEQVGDRGARVGPLRHGIPDRWECGVPVVTTAEWTAVLVGAWDGGVAADRQANGLELAAALLAPRVGGVVATGSGTATPHDAVPEIVGASEAMARVREAVVRAARAPFAVLIEGESGVGKELVARALHRLSARASGPFGDVNCAALPDEIIDAELFGHARGAFTGAVAERLGIFEAADGGTVFLDEVADLSARAQAKLLRVLQQQEVRRLGETVSRHIDVRVVSAANRQLRAAVRDGQFRQDLLYRLDVIRLGIPPLRDRPEDVAVLARQFWSGYAAKTGTQAVLTAEVFDVLRQHQWPGNVRELQNVIAGVSVSAPAVGFVRARHVFELLGATPAPLRPLAQARAAFERKTITEAVRRAGGNHAVAARALGLSRQGLAKMWIRLGLGTEAAAVALRAHAEGTPGNRVE